MSRKPVLPILFAIVMLACILFVAWYMPAVGQRRFELEDIQKSIETSHGRERKQQYEYDETVAAIPVTEAELERVLPLAEAAKEEAKALKQERKKLRNEKKELESSASADEREVTGNE